MALGTSFSIGKGKEYFPSKILQQLVGLPHEILDQLFLYTAQGLLQDNMFKKDDSSAQTNSPLPLALIDKCEKEHNISLEELKQIYTILCMLISHLARENLSKENQKAALIDLGFQKDTCETVLIPFFKNHLPSIQAILDQTYFDFARIVDVSWRLDYVLRSKQEGSIHVPLYLLEISTQIPTEPELQTISFTCQVEQLREIVYKLQELTNEIEKISQTTTTTSKTSIEHSI